VRCRPLGKDGQRRPHLAADTENDDVAVYGRKIVNQRLRRRSHEIF
jgi:hypothetical protein